MSIGTGDIERVLRENAALIGAILEQQNVGRVVSAAALLQRLQHNLAYVAAAAESDNRPPRTPAPNAAAAAAAGAATVRAHAPRPVALAPAPGVAVLRDAPHARAPLTHAWQPDELARLDAALARYATAGRAGRPDYRAIAAAVGSRTPAQVRSHLQKAAHKLRAVTPADPIQCPPVQVSGPPTVAVAPPPLSSVPMQRQSSIVREQGESNSPSAGRTSLPNGIDKAGSPKT